MAAQESYINIDKVAELKGLKSNRSLRVEINKENSKYKARKIKTQGGFTYVMKNFNSKEIKEFKKIACYIKRSMESHNKNKKNLEHKIAESLWRREKSFDFLCADLKKLLNIT